MARGPLSYQILPIFGGALHDLVVRPEHNRVTEEHWALRRYVVCVAPALVVWAAFPVRPPESNNGRCFPRVLARLPYISGDGRRGCSSVLVEYTHMVASLSSWSDSTSFFCTKRHCSLSWQPQPEGRRCQLPRLSALSDSLPGKGVGGGVRDSSSPTTLGGKNAIRFPFNVVSHTLCSSGRRN